MVNGKRARFRVQTDIMSRQGATVNCRGSREDSGATGGVRYADGRKQRDLKQGGDWWGSGTMEYGGRYGAPTADCRARER